MNADDNQRIKGFKTTLEESILNASQIFIVAHDGLDLDAIASAIGLYYICTKFKKTCYIVINDPVERLEAGVKKVIDKEKGNIPFITTRKYLELQGDNDLLITTDVNKKNRICLRENLKDFKDIVLIDHHGEDGFTIETSKKFISCGVSSASEIVTRLLCAFRVTIDENLANYLLAGIKLDTANFSKNSDPDTMDTVKKLLKSGASNEVVQNLFQENFESDVRIGELMKQLKFSIFQYAIAVGGSDEVYTREELAKAADKALKYGMDASFIIGYIDREATKVAISARSNGKIDVGKLMETLGGGGNPTSAATLVEGESAEELGEKLSLKLTSPFHIN